MNPHLQVTEDLKRVIHSFHFGTSFVIKDDYLSILSLLWWRVVYSLCHIGQIGGTKKTLRESVTNTLTGHLIIKPTIAPVDFFQFTSSRKLPLIPSDAVQDLLTSLSSNNSFEGVSERLRFGSLIGDDDSSTGAMVLAVNPETEAQVCPDLADIVKPLATENYAILSQYHQSTKPS